MSYTVVAFHTVEYADCATRFRDRCAALGLRSEVMPMQSTGDWARNTGLKPLALMRHRDRISGPLLYLDIDTLLMHAPELPAGEWDLATGVNPIHAHKSPTNAAAFFVGDTVPARQMLELWRTFVRRYGGRDHRHLDGAMRHIPDLRVADATSLLRGCLHINGHRPERTQAFA